MNDIEEMLRSAVEDVEPRPGALERHHRAQRLRLIRRRVAVYALVAAVVTAIGVWAMTSLSGVERPPRPAHTGQPAPLPSRPIAFFGVSSVNPDGSDVTRLSPSAGSTPAWSPDGTEIVFALGNVVDDRSHGLAIMEADGSNVRRLTTQRDYLPDWSPDGTRIAFVRDRRNLQVWVINVDGSGLRQLTHLDGSLQPGPSWSPDGRELVFGGGRGDDAYIVEADGTGLRNITEDHPSGTFQPKWSPNGDRIVYASSWEGGWAIFTMATDGTHVRRLTDLDVGEYPHPVWSPDGRWIAFADKHDPLQPSIYIMTAAGQQLQQVIAGRDAVQPNW